MAAIRPNYHPSLASTQINVTNNLDYSDTLCWYDEQSVDNIKFPSIFTYKKTSGWDGNLNLKLKTVVLNSNSGSISNISPNLPSSEGSFEATLQLQNNNPPSMDLYFIGNIKINYEYDIDEHSSGYFSLQSISPSTFDASSNDYGLNKKITISYGVPYAFETGYEYSQLWIRATINWGKDANGNLLVSQTGNSYGDIEIEIPNSYVTDVIPTITIWTRIYSKQGSGPGPGPGGDYYEVTSDQEYWPYHMGTEVQQTSGGWDTKGEITIPVGRYPIYTTTSDGWVIFIYDGHYCKIP